MGTIESQALVALLLIIALAVDTALSDLGTLHAPMSASSQRSPADDTNHTSSLGGLDDRMLREMRAETYAIKNLRESEIMHSINS